MPPNPASWHHGLRNCTRVAGDARHPTRKTSRRGGLCPAFSRSVGCVLVIPRDCVDGKLNAGMDPGSSKRSSRRHNSEPLHCGVLADGKYSLNPRR